MSDFLYQVGDEYEGSPILAQRFIAEVMGVGGLVEIDGAIVRIIYLPASVHGEQQIIDKYDDGPKQVTISYVTDAELAAMKAAEEVVVPAPEPVVEIEAFENEGGTVVVEDFKEVAVVEPAKKPATKRGRPRKVTTEE